MSKLQIEGSIKQTFKEENGQGKNGPWRKQDFLVVYGEGQYPKELLLTAWGDMIAEMHKTIGRRAFFSIEPASRESNGKYYTNTKVWRVE